MTRRDPVVRELASRSLSGTVGHLLMLTAAQIMAPANLPFEAWLVFLPLLVLRLVARGTLNYRLLAFCSIACNLSWGLLVANAYHTSGESEPAIVFAFFLCGIATASTFALAPRSWLQRTALAALVLPAPVFCVFGLAAWHFALLHLIFLLFTIVQGTLATNEYRNIVLGAEQRLALEVELRQAQKLEAIGRLAAGIAHEINTPVQFVTDSCTFMSDGIVAMESALADYKRIATDLGAGPSIAKVEEAHDLVFMRENLAGAAQRSLEGLQRVAKIVRATKDFAARSTLKAPANLNIAIESTLVICAHETRDVADVVTELGELPLVTCASGEINQALLNIIVNAAHAIGDQAGERGKITIKSWADPEWVRIAISDTGGGIPTDVLDKIFEPFFTTKPVGKGTGQGLAIARSIVVGKHGGQLDVASQPGIGTTFTIALPAA
ncbi:MAG: ATP-binding protein [Kofleriaceae bacterium]